MKPIPPIEERPVSKRKSTKRWCRGKEGVEHETRLIIDARRLAYSVRQDRGPCYLYESPNGGFRRWVCSHVEICHLCGKIIEHWPACPDKPQEEATTANFLGVG